MTFNKEITLPSLIEKLTNAGIDDMKQIMEMQAMDLKKELNLTKQEMKQVVEARARERGTMKMTAEEIIQLDKDKSISTNCTKMDELLEYGIPPRKITEICGESGSGKTQICMQAAVNVQRPKDSGGADGECIYIDTEGSFTHTRLMEIAKGYNKLRVMQSIHYFRIKDNTEFMAIMTHLPEIMDTYKNVRLIIVDSIAYHFRINVLESPARIAMLNHVARVLSNIALKNYIGVLVTNHVTQEAGSESPWTPSLGPSWGHWPYNRLFLYRKRQNYFAYLYKSIDNMPKNPVQFCIKDQGITDPDEDEIDASLEQVSDTQAEIETAIDTVWTDLKNKQIKEHEEEEEQAKVDDFWDEACMAKEFLSQLPPDVHFIKREDDTGLFPAVEEEVDPNLVSEVNSNNISGSDISKGKKRSHGSLDDEKEPNRVSANATSNGFQKKARSHTATINGDCL